MPARPRPPVGNVSVVVPFRSVYPSPFAVLELYVVVRAVHHGINVAAGHARSAARHGTQARPLARMLHSVVQRDSHSTDVRARLAVLAGFGCGRRFLCIHDGRQLPTAAAPRNFNVPCEREADRAARVPAFRFPVGYDRPWVHRVATHAGRFCFKSRKIGARGWEVSIRRDTMELKTSRSK